MTADNAPLADPNTSNNTSLHSNKDTTNNGIPPGDPMQRTRSRDMVDPSQLVDEDPLLISQTLTYVTDDGSVLHSFQSSPFSFSFKVKFIIVEALFVLLVITAVPIGAHGTVVAITVANLLLVAWVWYNLVRSVDVTSEGALRFWIGNIEVEVPFDKIINIKRTTSSTGTCSVCPIIPTDRGFLSNPDDGVSIITSVASTPFWLWPRSAGKPERSFCFGLIMCPKLTVVFSPSCGSANFIRDVEAEMRNFANGSNQKRQGNNPIPKANNPDFLDV
mmetsp:Transcript_16612/g.45990  ORF Transcript_16612/g.45990 Transcript_16612/m.45990 type:complete len:275 (-) Transcript_16612:418-1242(-)|eukprot:CAMPEP_0198111120 /NCGR_PEP_ID=MMETSP1442-20131203/3096_1 /TAXON_ID= /ORGANISM="Craspedostauros australis, Strain CCMP3328" /LENGTH=274 /DNA_ID=CAMNT_0043767437 /DNA_START=336 /DNA_END=1160 /DNA_ORIENTATION=+